MHAATPDRRHRGSGGGISRRVLFDLQSLVETGRLAGYAVLEILTLLRWTLATLLSILGFGRIDRAFAALRANADRQRAWASQRLGRRLIAHYEPALPPSRSKGLVPLGTQLQDRARARDLDWHLVNPVASAVAAAVPAIMLGYGAVIGALVLHVVVGVLRGYYEPWTLDGSHVVTGALGLALLIAAPVVARLLQRVHARWVSFMLAAGSSATLEARVASLTETRKTALELQEAEIRRIERDLHDGAQARLVTMGMTLTQASRLLEHDPAAARSMVEAAKEDSSAALKELRTLVRGIRPPILADRGLVEAVRSLAAGCPVECRVISTLQARPVPTIETALYFAVAELLANAGRHSAASEIVIDLGTEGDALVARVTDNGIGGALEVEGGGLSGLVRRLAPFDGTLDFVSPVGGPTVATARIPCPAS